MLNSPADAHSDIQPEELHGTPEQYEQLGSMSELGLAFQPIAAYAKKASYVSSDTIKAVYERSAFKRFYDRSPVLQAVTTDFSETDSKIATLGLGAAAAIYQIYDRRRWIVTIVPPAIISTMQETQNSNKAGLAGALLFSGWIAIGAELTSAGIGRFPNTTESLAKKFSNALNASSKALGTAESVVTRQEEKGNTEVSQSTRVLTIGKKIAKTVMKPVVFPIRHFGRGLSAIALGSTAYVTTARAQGRSSSDIRKRVTLPLVADSAFTVGIIGKGTTEGLKWLALNGHYQAAEKIQDVLESKWTWNGVAGFTIALGLGFWLKDRHDNKKRDAEDNTNITSELDNTLDK